MNYFQNTKIACIFTLVFIGSCKADKFQHCKLSDLTESGRVLKLSNGDRYNGFVYQDLINWFSEVWVNDGLREGVETVWLSPKKKVKLFETTYKAGLKEGSFTAWHGQSHKVTSRGQYRNDKNEGYFMYFDKSGVITSLCNYSKGLQDGQNICFYPSGIVKFSGNYEAGLKKGKWIYWDESGNKLREEFLNEKEQAIVEEEDEIGELFPPTSP